MSDFPISFLYGLDWDMLQKVHKVRQGWSHINPRDPLYLFGDEAQLLDPLTGNPFKQ